MSTPANKYKKRKKWSQEDMAAAVQAVREKRMGYLKAAITYNVPRTTVFRLAKQTDLPMEDILTKKIGRKPVFNKAFEDMLVTYALLMEDKLYGLTQMDMRRIAYQLADRNNWKKLEEAEKKKNKKIQKVAQNAKKDQSKENNKRKGKGTGKGQRKVGSEQEGKRRSGKSVEKKDKNKAKTQSAAKRKILQEEITDSDSDATFTSDKSEEELTYESVKQPTRDDCVCFFCNGKYAEDRRGEEWVQCFMCECWVHSECGGYDTGCYVCDYCKN